jgi:hypothetical protein
MRRILIVMLVLVTGCTAAVQEPAPALHATPDSTPPATHRGSQPPAPALVLIGLAVGAALMIALISNTAMMPDTAP